ncbi:hypothetical protein PIIN_02916 [Serendipita indica DSM 11827]|uniref:Uncharacterized protein n=1 Tax=Serendipita indica (strain DSM 11827) TaxID=1109443 RepID=G4TCL4_SERID|nr:hypothetical protein PIIN_02916 [Serendipita indica DSM 11827]
MPQIERPTLRQPLRDLPLSLFIHPDYVSGTSLLGKKRPYSPSYMVSPSKRRLLAVEGVLSPRSPFKKAVADLQRALPSANTTARVLSFDTPQPSRITQSDVPMGSPVAMSSLPKSPARRSSPVKSIALGLAPSLEVGPSYTQPKPRVAAEPSQEEAQLLAALAAAPKPTQVYLPGAAHPRPKRSKEDDPEEDHYPGFDIPVDDDETEEAHPSRMEAEDEDDATKENQQPVDEYALRFSTPLSSRSSMSSLSGRPIRRPTRRTGRGRLQDEVDGDFSSDDDLL